jgi:hypothetical protein
MTHGHEKSDLAIVAVRRRTNRSDPLRSWWSKGQGPRGNAVCAKHALNSTPSSRGAGSDRMRQWHYRLDPRWEPYAESRTYGPGRGCEVTRVPYREVRPISASGASR